MKKILYTISILALTLQGFSQAQDKGAISIDLGADLGAHFNQYDSKYNGATIGDTDSSGAATTMFRFDAHYNIVKLVSVGLHYRGGKYLEDENDLEIVNNKVNMIGLGVRLYPVNKDKFVWYLGATLGSSKLEINRQIVILVTIPYQAKYKSSHVGFETGFSWYFAKNFGLNMGLGYSGQKFLMTDYSINNDPLDLTNWENILTTAGVHLNMGLAVKFGGN